MNSITLKVVINGDSIRVIGKKIDEDLRALVDELRLAAIDPHLFSDFRKRWSQFAAQAMAVENAILFAQKEGRKVEVDTLVSTSLEHDTVEFSIIYEKQIKAAS